MDALSETLRVVRLVGAIFIHGRFTAPWCYQSPHADAAAPLLEPTAERVVIFHLITEGELSGYGLVNAVTHYSQEIDDYDRATEFEALGGKLIELGTAEWKGLAEAI